MLGIGYRIVIYIDIVNISECTVYNGSIYIYIYVCIFFSVPYVPIIEFHGTVGFPYLERTNIYPKRTRTHVQVDLRLI